MPLVSLEEWPALPLETWKDTRDTIHMWTQVVGKIRLKLAPPVNHWWHVPLYVTSRGLTTTPIPFGNRTFDVTFDFIDHVLVVQTSDDCQEIMPLGPRSVADFYHDLMAALGRLGINVTLRSTPTRLPNRRASRRRGPSRHRCFTAPSSRFFSCRTTICAGLLILAPRYWSFFRVHTRRPPISADGIGRIWNGPDRELSRIDYSSTVCLPVSPVSSSRRCTEIRSSPSSCRLEKILMRASSSRYASSNALSLASSLPSAAAGSATLQWAVIG